MEDMRRMYEFSNKYYQYLFIDSMSKASMGEVDIDLSGNYFSTNNFVGKNKLEKEARQVLGRGWKAEDDVSQIQEIVDFLGGGYVVVASYSNQEWDEMYENYYLKNRNNDYLYDIFVISENEFAHVLSPFSDRKKVLLRLVSGVRQLLKYSWLLRRSFQS